MHLTSASLRTQLITLVCLVTLIPFAVGQWLSYRQTAAVIRENMDEQTRLNLQQMEKTLDATLASYEDLLYQIYTNDTVVELVNKLATGEDVALSRNQLRREIQEKVFAKPYLGAITVLFEDGSYSTYDKLLASSTSSTWLDGWDSAAMYSQVASTNTTHYFPSAYAITLMDQPHYLFHIAHRVIDWRHVENRNAIVILSVEETLLSDICNEEWRGGQAGSAYFLLTDADDHIVSGPLAEMVGLPREEAPSLLEGGGAPRGSHPSPAHGMDAAQHSGPERALYAARQSGPVHDFGPARLRGGAHRGHRYDGPATDALGGYGHSRHATRSAGRPGRAHFSKCAHAQGNGDYRRPFQRHDG